MCDVDGHFGCIIAPREIGQGRVFMWNFEGYPEGAKNFPPALRRFKLGEGEKENGRLVEL